MNHQHKLNTDEILRDFEDDITPDIKSIDFIDQREQLTQLSRRILEQYKSYSKFADASEVSPSQLNEFLNGKKGLSRSRLIGICITLNCTIRETRDVLRRLGYPDLYSRNRRDFEILGCIKQGKSLDETNDILLKNGFEDLHDRRQLP